MNFETIDRPKATAASPIRQVQKRICGYERTIDEGLEGGAEMLREMMVVSREASMDLAAGQAAIEAALTCLSTSAQLRRQAIRTHGALRRALATIDLREMGWGPLPDSPDAMQEVLGRHAEETGLAAG